MGMETGGYGNGQAGKPEELGLKGNLEHGQEEDSAEGRSKERWKRI